MSRHGIIGVGVSHADGNEAEAAVVYIDATAKTTTRLPKGIDGVKVRIVYSEPFTDYLG